MWPIPHRSTDPTPTDDPTDSGTDTSSEDSSSDGSDVVSTETNDDSGSESGDVADTTPSTDPTETVPLEEPIVQAPFEPLSSFVSELNAGMYHSCALTSGGHVMCWGRNGIGQVPGFVAEEAPIPYLVVAEEGSELYLSDVIQVSSGNDQSCALIGGSGADAGTVFCWGNIQRANFVGTTTYPLQVRGPNSEVLSGVKQVSVGFSHICALKESGQVFCWGKGDYGQLGNNNSGTNYISYVPVEVVGLNGLGSLGEVKQVSVGFSHTCALKESGQVVCWGGGDYGQLGNNNLGTNYISPVPVEVVGLNGLGILSGIRQLSAGNRYSCAVQESGRVFCWGNNRRGQLGSRALAEDRSSTPVEVDGFGISGTLNRGRQVSVSISNENPHTCATVSRPEGGTGAVCWGQTRDKALGGGATNQSRYNVAVVGPDGTGTLNGVQQVTVGQGFSCAWVEPSNGGSREYYCWGAYGLLGTGTRIGDVVGIPQIVLGASQQKFIEKISVGATHTCALTDEKGGLCWGSGQDGILGDGFAYNSEVPVNVIRDDQTLFDDLDQISSGARHSCAITQTDPQSIEKKVFCWGSGENGLLGNNSTIDSSVPVEVSSGLDFDISVGQEHTCTLRANAKVFCWGKGANGRLGTGSDTNALVPTEVVGADNYGFREASAGNYHTCALKLNGKIFCWGKGDSGQLGNHSQSSSNIPVAVVIDENQTPLTGVKQVTLGDNFTCVLKNNGQVLCWGEGSLGQLGNNSTSVRSLLPVMVVVDAEQTPLGNIKQISAGDQHACALGEAGSIHCWGAGGSGRLGYGNEANTPLAVAVVGVSGMGTLASMEQVSAGPEHTCALAGDSYGGSADYICWGKGESGRLANGRPTSSNYNTPTKVVSVGASSIAEVVPAFKEQISSGRGHTCSVVDRGEDESQVHCWGLGISGQLGNNFDSSSDKPVVVVSEDSLASLAEVSQVSSGGYHTCAISRDEEVLCWGYGGKGQLGFGQSVSSDRPVKVVVDDTESSSVTSLTSVVQVSSGELHTCALKKNGRVFCWGEGSYGRLGHGAPTRSDRAVRVKDAYGLVPLNGVVQISAGGFHTCAIQYNGAVMCWGRGAIGQLGNDGTDDSDHPVYTLDSNNERLKNITQLSSGRYHTCALESGGKVYCWGNGSGGRLGNHRDDNSMIAQQVLGEDNLAFSDVDQISSGDAHTCALATNGEVFCWGIGGGGRLGQGSSLNSLYATPVITGSGGARLAAIVEVSAGGNHTCALREGGETMCWGYGGSGRLGYGDYTSSLFPRPLLPVGRQAPMEKGFVQKISAGQAHTCVISDGYLGSSVKVLCWGEGGYGELGNGTIVNSPAPVKVKSLEDPEQVSVGDEHTCALKKNGKVSCWGSHHWGHLGDGVNSTTLKDVPVAVIGLYGQGELNDIKQISVGAEHTCAVSTEGNVFCWGKGHKGQLGKIVQAADYATPLKVSGVNGYGSLGGIEQVSLGEQHSCALNVGGQVFCWGAKANGVLGHGVSESGIQGSPIQVKSLNGLSVLGGIEQISSGRKHTCALKYDGSVYCWGLGESGRLGNGDDLNESSTLPVQVKGPNGNGFLGAIVRLNTGGNHTCALNEKGIVYCWGQGSNGQLGSELFANSNVPVKVLEGGRALEDIKDIAAGLLHTCAIKKGGQVLCWGFGESGRLGYDEYSSSSTPVFVASGAGVTVPLNLSRHRISEKISGLGLHHCALHKDGTAHCWGNGTDGQLGSGYQLALGSFDEPISRSFIPLEVRDSTGLSPLTEIR